jgi:antitoxin ParD1/3/4
LNISLTPQFEKLIRQKVKTGQYQTASEVIRDALRLLQERDQIREGRLEALKDQIDIGVRQINRGEVVDLDISALKKRVRRQPTRTRPSRRS